MTPLAESYAHTTSVLGGDLWGDPTEAEMRRMDAERACEELDGEDDR